MNNKELVFDYGHITSEHKKVVEEVINIANSSGHEMFAELLKIKFQIKDIPIHDINNSEFINICKKINVTYTVQGYTKETINGEEIKFPLISVCADIRQLDKIIETAKK